MIKLYKYISYSRILLVYIFYLHFMTKLNYFIIKNIIKISLCSKKKILCLINCKSCNIFFYKYNIPIQKIVKKQKKYAINRNIVINSIFIINIFNINVNYYYKNIASCFEVFQILIFKIIKKNIINIVKRQKYIKLYDMILFNKKIFLNDKAIKINFFLKYILNKI